MTGDAAPQGVPPAFRRRDAGIRGFIGMEDDQVLKVATAALRMAEILPVGSRPRAEQWRMFDRAMAELGERAVSHALGRLREIHERGRS